MTTLLSQFFSRCYREKEERELEAIVRIRTKGEWALVPGHFLLVQKEVHEFDAVTQGHLGVLGHGQNRADGLAHFHLVQGWNAFGIGLLVFRAVARHPTLLFATCLYHTTRFFIVGSPRVESNAAMKKNTPTPT